MTMIDTQAFFQESQQRLETLLDQDLTKHQVVSTRLSEAIRYTVLNGGKRFRPALCYATALALKAKPEAVNCVAGAIELIHCYSLVHDDLPSMDDDDLRRGKPTCHIAFDEATAILAGDALQAHAFQFLLQYNPEIPAQNKLDMIEALAMASGSEGVAAGQALDLEATNQVRSIDELEQIHRFKTGKIISACVQLSLIALGHKDDASYQALMAFSDALGLAFQVKDDILDVEGCTEKLGKASGADEARNKNTYPSLMGLEAAQRKAEELYDTALASLSNFGPEADTLRKLARYVIHREN